MLYNIENLIKRRSRGQGYCLLIRSLKIEHGERIAITGPSGCGKSTVLDTLGLALRPDEAERFDFLPCENCGLPVAVMDLWQQKDLDSLADLRLRYMGYVLQSGELLPFLDVVENMTLTARLAGIPKNEAFTDASHLANSLCVAHLLSAMPNTLSFGERQRVAIVRALVSRPVVILADEPTASLDPLHADKVMEAFLTAVEEYGSTLVLVTHNASWAKKGGLREFPFRLEKNDDGQMANLDDGRDS